MNPSRLLALATLGGHWIASLGAWPRVPSRVQVRGTGPGAGEWTQVTWLDWFGLPLASLALVFLIWLLAAWLGRHPILMEVGSRARFRKLPSEARARVLRGTREGLEWAALPVSLVFFLVHIGVLQALSGRTSLPWTLGGMALSLVAFSVLLSLLRRRVRGAVDREWRESGPPAMQE